MKFYAEIDLQNRIKPLYNSDYDTLKRIKKNEPLEINAVNKRNYKFHKKVMALFNIGFENQEQIKSFDNYRKIVTMKAGYYTTEITDKGVAYFAESISYANMEQQTFEDLFNRLLDVISKQLDTAAFEIRNQIEDFM
jgi:hypothetical protein